MQRNIMKTYRVTQMEADELREKAQKACRSESGLVRELIHGYEPREKPGEEFYAAMNEIATMADRLQSILINSRGITIEENHLLTGEILRWRKFQADIEHRFLTPEDGVAKWL